MVGDPDLRIYEIECGNGHSVDVNPTELEEWITSEEHECAHCGDPMTITGPSDFALVCRICDGQFHTTDPDEATWLLEDGCPKCGEYGFHGSVCVPNSWSYWYGIYDWTRNGKDVSPLSRAGRTDYWEGLVHFCEVVEFISIYESRCISAANTGYYRVPAVCLTEATVENWPEIQKTHGTYGFVFRKKDVIQAGGAPAMYLPEQLIAAQRQHGGFADEVKHLVNLLRIPSTSPGKKKVDFLHEREWRTPSDIDFGTVKPYAVVIGGHRPRVPKWHCVLEAAMEFDELLGTAI